MKVFVKLSRASSKKNISNIKRKIKKLFKRKNKRCNREHLLTPPRDMYHRNKVLCKIDMPEKIVFPEDIKILNSTLERLKEYKTKRHSYMVSIDHRKMDIIDNASILLMTVGINNIFNGEKLIRSGKVSPAKSIDQRLAAIGYWDALCINPKKEAVEEGRKYLKIDYRNGESIDNEFHYPIIDFFTGKDEILEKNKDELFDAIFEAMANSSEHAFVDFDGDKKIWFMGAYNKKEKEIEFIFYDTGIGIFKSLEMGRNKFVQKFYRISRRIGKESTLRTLCKSNLSKYKDKNNNRGFGMIAFKNFIDTVSQDHNKEACLEVATDEFLYLTKHDKIIRLKSKIQGTFIRWSIRDLRTGV
ncbi:hypothetical protein KDE13_07590 [Campylobacter sp. faydin G-140]|uniref:hypothetical protein n=1 Tax=Campylobacter anatolicus TaxID=2829105 RepID=UPI001B8DCB56|nr:hypothetical protein [Campylobacter anatolicus]MBR8466200.1 hypothetical protein [Campylobacter anatolicus]